MRLLDRLRMMSRTLFRRNAAGAALEDELRFHLDQQIAEYRAAGMSEVEARQAALRLFGNPSVVREHARATWSWQWLESLVRETRQGARRLMRAPSFSLTAIARSRARHRRECRALFRRECRAAQAAARCSSRSSGPHLRGRQPRPLPGQRRRRRMLRALAAAGAQLCPDEP